MKRELLDTIRATFKCCNSSSQEFSRLAHLEPFRVFFLHFDYLDLANKINIMQMMKDVLLKGQLLPAELEAFCRLLQGTPGTQKDQSWPEYSRKEAQHGAVCCHAHDSVHRRKEIKPRATSQGQVDSNTDRIFDSSTRNWMSTTLANWFRFEHANIGEILNFLSEELTLSSWLLKKTTNVSEFKFSNDGTELYLSVSFYLLYNSLWQEKSLPRTRKRRSTKFSTEYPHECCN